MRSTDFTPLAALLGGATIGLSAVLLMLLFGRIARISGIAVRLLPPFLDRDVAGRWAFVAGLVAAPAVWRLASDGWPEARFDAGSATLLLAGLLVGFGAVWGRAAPRATESAGCRGSRPGPSWPSRPSWRPRSLPSFVRHVI